MTQHEDKREIQNNSPQLPKMSAEIFSTLLGQVDWNLNEACGYIDSTGGRRHVPDSSRVYTPLLDVSAALELAAAVLGPEHELSIAASNMRKSIDSIRDLMFKASPHHITLADSICENDPTELPRKELASLWPKTIDQIDKFRRDLTRVRNQVGISNSSKLRLHNQTLPEGYESHAASWEEFMAHLRQHEWD